MADIFYAFGIGIGFSVGVLSGAMLCQLATKTGRKDFDKMIEKTNRMTEDRLTSYVYNTERIASCLERMEADSHTRNR